jgi:hypothetical protein
MRVELTRFRVKSGKSARVDEWLAMLNSRMDEVKETLVREEMTIEVIFREMIDDEEYLYWFTVQGEAGEEVNTSPHPLDHDHIAFHKECIDQSYGARDAQPQVIIIPDEIAAKLGWLDPAADRSPFVRREIIHLPLADYPNTDQTVNSLPGLTSG